MQFHYIWLWNPKIKLEFHPQFLYYLNPNKNVSIPTYFPYYLLAPEVALCTLWLAHSAQSLHLSCKNSPKIILKTENKADFILSQW